MELVPQFVERGPIHLVGMCGWFRREDAKERIPGLWARFVPRMDAIAARSIGCAAWGACFGDDPARPTCSPDFFYMAAFEVDSLDDLPPDMVGKTVPANRYAVFTHTGGLAGLHDALNRVWLTWLPKSGFRTGGAPDFERYGERFDPATGQGEIELWVPIGPRA